MKRPKLYSLMQRYVTGQVTEQEKKKIEAWLDVQKTDKGPDPILTDEDEERLFRKIVSGIDGTEEVHSRPWHTAQGFFKRHQLRIAACLLLALSAAFLPWLITNVDTSPLTTTNSNGMKKEILDDGTIVWMKEGSRLTYAERDGIRHASLTGEALFEVAKDPTVPFVIDCEKLVVKVVGTSFHLKSTAEEVELRVLTGTVSLSSMSNGDAVELRANEKAHATNGRISKAPLNPAEVLEVTGATEYNMAFQNVEFRKVAEQISKKFEVSIVLQDTNAERCRLTADFTDHSLDSTLAMLTELLDIGYKTQDGTVTITGSGCN